MGLREIKTAARSAEESISADRLRELLHYDPETGEFMWRHAGTVGPDGYVQINIDGKLYYGQRLAVLYMTGEWPEDIVDHDNRNRSDNRWENLKSSDASRNAMNSGLYSTNTSGVRGVCWHKKRQKWHAKIDVRGTRVHLGYYDSIEEAKTARDEAMEKYHGAA